MAGFGIIQANDFGFDGKAVFVAGTVNGENKYVVNMDSVFPTPPTGYSGKLDDFIYWFLTGLNKAEKGVNEMRQTHKSNSFRDPVYSPPVLQSNGEYHSTVTF